MTCILPLNVEEINGLLKTTCLVAEGELSIDMTGYFIFGSVNIVEDIMCDCMSARNKFRKVQGVTGFFIIVIMNCIVFTNYIPGEMDVYSLSINADCQGTQINFFANFV